MDIIWIVAIFVLLIAVALLAVLAARRYFGDRLSVATDIRGGADDPIITRTTELLDEFMTGPLTPALALRMERAAGDINFDADTLTAAKLSRMPAGPRNTAAAKVILDTMLHYYIYRGHPNVKSRKIVADNLAALRAARTVFDARTAELARVATIAKSHLETKTVYASPREYFRTVQVLLAAPTTATDSTVDSVELQNEISRCKTELRMKTEELERARLATINNSYGTAATTSMAGALTSRLLDDCNRERRELQEKMYELRRDIDRLRAGGATRDVAVEGVLRSRVEGLMARNSQLETELRDAERAHGNEAQQISALSSELINCKTVLEQVLATHGGVQGEKNDQREIGALSVLENQYNIASSESDEF